MGRRYEKESAADWLVVGTRPGGDRVVLAEAASRAEAEREALALSACEGYTHVGVELYAKRVAGMADAAGPEGKGDED